MTEERATDPTSGGQKGIKPEDYSLLSPAFLAEVARVLNHGTQKYSRENWRLGYPWSWSLAAQQRHVIGEDGFWAGQSYDKDSGLHHLAHAAAHLMFMYEFDKYRLGTDDRMSPPGALIITGDASGCDHNWGRYGCWICGKYRDD